MKYILALTFFLICSVGMSQHVQVTQNQYNEIKVIVVTPNPQYYQPGINLLPAYPFNNNYIYTLPYTYGANPVNIQYKPVYPSLFERNENSLFRER